MAKDKNKHKKTATARTARPPTAPPTAPTQATAPAPLRPTGAPSLKGKEYEKQLRKLQVELCHLQAWVKAKGLRVIILFEGRDAAGKGGTIRAITERVSPRVFRIVGPAGAVRPREVADVHAALHAALPRRRARSCMFDRSWYNRAGVEPVMGFCTKEQYERFLQRVPGVRDATSSTAASSWSSSGSR